MYFQVSPAHKKPKSTKATNHEEEEIPILTLVPFTPVPKLSFQDVAVNALHEIKLNVVNKKPVPVFVKACFDGSEELEFSQSWCEQRIEANDAKLLEFYWFPNIEYSGRHNIKVTCLKQMWNIPITFKSVLPKKSKKKITTTLVKKTSPSIKKNARKTAQKLSTMVSTKKQPVWNDKPYVPKKNSCDKENLDTNSKCENFRSSSNISFDTSTPDNIRRFTYAVNKLGFAREGSPNFNDSLEAEDLTRRLALKGIQLNDSSLGEIFDKNVGLDSPFTPFFKPSRVLSELPKRDGTERDFLENPGIIRNLSFEMQAGMNISSETRIIGNLSSESFRVGLDSNTFVKDNISTETYIKEENFECHMPRGGNSEMRPEQSSRESYGNHNGDWKTSDLNVSSVTYVKHERSFQTNRSSDSFSEKLEHLGEHYLSIKTNSKDSSHFNGVPLSNFSVFRKDSSPKNGIDEIIPTIRITGEHSLFPIREEPTDESMRRTQIKRKSDTTFGISPIKRQNLSPETWSKVGGVYKTQMSVQRATTLSTPKQKAKKITYVEKKTITIADPFILAATTAVDPFLTNTIYLDQEWIQRQEDRFKNWLNMLLTPPTDLDVSDEKVDTAKLWRECSQKDVAAAPTKEEVCIKYHTSSKLDALRRSAREFYRSDNIQCVLAKVYDAIEKRKIEIRQDRNVHLDLSLQSKVMTLLLSYNPLWLRIALEVIYREELKLSSNSDLLGLSKFLYGRFFKDRTLARKHKSVHNPKYNVDIKKFMLKKYFAVVYFLDRAKSIALIPHDPCLFRKNAEVKDSREMLIQFTRDAITAAVGDITKYLKLFGYFVEHQQTYIHEFDYAVNSLGGDLRDGVRLSRVMEVILLRNDLTRNLRVPAISRLQKIHNVKLVFESLAKAGYEIQHEIEPYHIVDGHREKTLSFLWQIIYKFQAPLVIETARSIQKWWRSLPVCVKRAKLRRQHREKMEAATKIQGWFRRQKQARELTLIASLLVTYLKEQRRQKAAVKIQSFYKMYKQRKNYIRLYTTVTKLQQKCRFWLKNVCYRQRESAAIVIQKNVKRYIARNRFLQTKLSVLVIEKYVLARKTMLSQRQQYVTIKSSVITIQRWYRATIQMRKTRTEYEKLRCSTVVIQRHLRATFQMREDRNHYLSLKKSVHSIQTKYKANKMMLTERENFVNLKTAAIFVQTKFRANKVMKIERDSYLHLKKSTVIIQNYFRGYLCTKKCREDYLELRMSAVKIQRWYGANKLMCAAKKEYRNLRKAVIFVQRRVRANNAMKKQREVFLREEWGCVVIQRYYRSFTLMRKERAEYLELRSVTCFIQQKYRAKLAMKECRERYTNLKQVCITVQRRFRANKLMQSQREEYRVLKRTVNFVETKFLANKKMMKVREEYQKLRKYTIIIQRIYRARKFMRTERKSYLELRNSAIKIQNYFRGYLLMKKEKQLYLTIKLSTIKIQRKFRAHRDMIRTREYYNRLKQAVLFVQRRFRANKLMKQKRDLYVAKQNACTTIQTYFRSYLLMKKERNDYLVMKNSAILIQQRFIAYKMMRSERTYYVSLKRAVIVIQTRYRANKLMQKQRRVYLEQRKSCTIIQMYYRGYLLMRKEQQSYSILKSSTTFIQQKYRAKKAMEISRTSYQRLKQTVVYVQRKFRANRATKIQRAILLSKKNAAVKIQKFFRGYQQMKKDRMHFLTLTSGVIYIQRMARGFLTRKRYAHLLTPEAREERRMGKIREAAATKIQARWRGYLQRQNSSNVLVEIRKRSETATREADPQESLGNRGNRALDMLVAEEVTVPMIISALTDFEYVTRRSPEMCNQLGPLLSEQLYLLIQSVGRSLPDIKICEISAHILINLCKYEPTRVTTWCPDYLDSMLKIMTHWCDKDNMAFPSLCTLFWLFAHIKEYKETILQLPNANQRIEKIHGLVLRKQKMVAKSESKMVTSRFISKKPLYLPGLKPDWGFDYPTRPRLFMNSIQAIECLKKILR